MRAGTCKHFTGCGIVGRDTCGAEVHVRKHVGGPDFGWGTRLPCMPHDNAHPCDQYAEPTPEEIAAFDAETDELVARMQRTEPLIKKLKQEHVGKNARGIAICPECEGKLHWSHAAYNGHVWGKCETDGCLNWAE